MNIDRLSLNTATVSKQWNLEQCIEACKRHEIKALAPWRKPLQECGVSKAAKLIKQAGLKVSGLCRGGMFPANNPKQRKSIIEDNYRAVDEALAIKADCLILVVGGLADNNDLEDARQQVYDSIEELLIYARQYHMPLAIEPLHPLYAADRACINTLSQALDICDQLGDGLGIAADIYHIWWDPQLTAQLKRAEGQILGYHVCDWLKKTQNLLTDRGMMGDGVVNLKKISTLMDSTGYNNWIEVEIFSDFWWKQEPDKVIQILKERFVTQV